MLGVVELVKELGQTVGYHHEARVLHGDLHVVTDGLHADGDGGPTRSVLDDLQVKNVPELVEAAAHDGHLGDVRFDVDLYLDGLHIRLGLEVESQTLDLGAQVDLFGLGVLLFDFHLVDVQEVVDEFFQSRRAVDDHAEEFLLLFADAALGGPQGSGNVTLDDAQGGLELFGHGPDGRRAHLGNMDGRGGRHGLEHLGFHLFEFVLGRGDLLLEVGLGLPDLADLAPQFGVLGLGLLILVAQALGHAFQGVQFLELVIEGLVLLVGLGAGDLGLLLSGGNLVGGLAALGVHFGPAPPQGFFLLLVGHLFFLFEFLHQKGSRLHHLAHLVAPEGLGRFRCQRALALGSVEDHAAGVTERREDHAVADGAHDEDPAHAGGQGDDAGHAHGTFQKFGKVIHAERFGSRLGRRRHNPSQRNDLDDPKGAEPQITIDRRGGGAVHGASALAGHQVRHHLVEPSLGGIVEGRGHLGRIGMIKVTSRGSVQEEALTALGFHPLEKSGQVQDHFGEIIGRERHNIDEGRIAQSLGIELVNLVPLAELLLDLAKLIGGGGSDIAGRGVGRREVLDQFAFHGIDGDRRDPRMALHEPGQVGVRIMGRQVPRFLVGLLDGREHG